MSRKPSHLLQQLQAFGAGFLQRLPLDERRALEAFLAPRPDFDPAAKAPQEGAVAPDFALPDQHGRIVRLRDRIAQGPVILLFVRGGWCPFCTLTLRAYQDWLPEFHQEGAELLAITPQPARMCSQIAERDLLAFPTLSDHGDQVAELYGIASELDPALRPMHLRMGHDLPAINGTGDWRIPLPATFVIDADGRVARSHVARLFSERLEPSDALAALRGLPAMARHGVDA
jgi:peroxiredoxin